MKRTVIIMVLVWGSTLSAAEQTRPVQDPLEISSFGWVVPQPQEKGFGVRWAEPRKITRIVVPFETAPSPEVAEGIGIQYWQRVWDGRPDPVLAEETSGKVGWDAMDDWTNGQWINAKIRRVQEGDRLIFTFEPIGTEEIKSAAGGLTYRKTLWIRLHSDTTLPTPKAIRAYTESAVVSVPVRIQFGKPADTAFTGTESISAKLETFNGECSSVKPADAKTTVENLSWTVPADGTAAVTAEIRTMHDPIDQRYDRTIVTVRCGKRSFSFATDDIARGERILVDDLGALVTRADDAISIEEYRAIVRREFGGRSIYDRIGTSGEQTLGRAWNEMPLKRPLYFVHGLPGNRDAMNQLPNGDIEIAAGGRWFNLPVSARDTKRQSWQGGTMKVHLGFPADSLRGGRELKEGFLPLLRTWWQAGPVYYEQTSILAPLDGDLKEIALDDPTVLLMQIRMVNLSENQKAAANLRFSTEAQNEGNLVINGDQAINESRTGPHVRFLIFSNNNGIFEADGRATNWTTELAAGQSVTLRLTIPSITVHDAEMAVLRTLDFNAEATRVCAFWKEQTDRGTQIQTPEPWLNDFYKAHLRHLLVNCYKEIGTEYLHAHVGTFHYGVYPNESAMMISDLDRRGYPDLARRNLDALLHYQGTVGFTGNYQSKQGEFYGSGGHETGNYNKSHGYVMWNLAYHWRYTRDRAWMEKSAPGMIASCEWVIRERNATQTLNPDGTKPIEYGYLPTGSLEDVTDYWNWMATNSATVWGFRDLADALAEFGHPEGPRLQKEAKAYFDDFMAGVNESRIRCPVVSLRDHTWVPKIPSEVHFRGRAHGWIREVLEGSMFLPAYGLLAPDDPQTRWILKDYEDNLYIGNGFGYEIGAFDDFWFSRGGFSQQANLLDGPLPYLWRDQVEHYLRAFFNGFASAFYPEIRMCNEHSLPELGYPRGDHFKSSDEAQVTYWLRLMFVNEQQDTLYLGQAIPRYWLSAGNTIGIQRAATQFGELSLSYQAVDRNQVIVTLEPPKRNPPKTIYLRIRHAKSNPIQSVLCNDKPWTQFDKDKEWLVLPGALDSTQRFTVQY